MFVIRQLSFGVGEGGIGGRVGMPPDPRFLHLCNNKTIHHKRLKLCGYPLILLHNREAIKRNSRNVQKRLAVDCIYIYMYI